MRILKPMHKAGVALACSMLMLQACSNNDDDPSPDGGAATGASYTVSAVNLTNGQPMSPPVVALHTGDYRVFTVGAPASVALEVLAEGGSNADLVTELSTNASVISSATGADPIPPGGNASYTVADTADSPARFVSMATMLVNTNDAFTGINRADISALQVGESMSVNAVAYDSGTEVNSEGAGTIPGPADGGEGFNAVRDDISDAVNMHSGVVTSSDGLAGSILTNDHRFLNPVMRITVTRTE